MRLSAPKKVTWIVAVVLGALGVLGVFAAIPVVSANAFWFVVVGFVLLALATLLGGL